MEQNRISPRSPRAALEPERMPMPVRRRRSRSARHPLVIAGNAIFTTVILLAIIGGIVLMVGKQRFEAPGPLVDDKTVNISRGLRTREIADLLAREGVIDQPWTFIGGVIVRKVWEDLKFGEYQFARHASLKDIVDTLVEGKVIQHQITIPEGLTSEMIIQRLLDNPTLTGTIREIPREGTLLPDSFRFTRGTSREQMTQRLQQAQRRALLEIWERRAADLPVKTPEDLVTLASIIEKETGQPDERTRVAAVFVNRLKQKMRLQSDPTIVYGLVGGKGTLGRPILRSEITQPTPYNTYVIDGLPPGPIANPGRAALEAAANPARTKDLFFVADGTGGHAFSETLEAHNRHVARLRAREQQQNGSAAPAEPAVAPPDNAAQPEAPSRTRPATPRRQRGAAARSRPAEQ
ncbi:MAG: endolytic transglycosylase MltG [Proteobacteria bacterium]|nr:endolytic transglycosylase MltG [Pseudomonadota bacterium]